MLTNSSLSLSLSWFHKSIFILEIIISVLLLITFSLCWQISGQDFQTTPHTTLGPLVNARAQEDAMRARA